jgi:Right handed beta helix region
MLRIHSRILMGLLFSVVALAFGTQEAHATTTYIVGTCKTGTTFTTIQAALDASPSPTIVEVCPGTYNQQIKITKAVTLEGIVGSGSDQAIIAVPSGGLAINATDDFGHSIGAQVLVQAVSGVDISNMVIDGTGNNLSGSDLIAGIFYQNSAGTIDHVVTRNQFNDYNGYGMDLEGGSLHPSVTVENCSVHDFDSAGINVETDSTSSELTVKIEGNLLAISDSGVASAFFFDSGTTVTATDNYIKAGGGYGFTLNGAAGSVTGNTIVAGFISLYVDGDGDISFKSNKLLDPSEEAIYFLVATNSTEIEDNTITRGTIGIEFGCNSTNGKVHSNTIMDFTTGLDQLPSGTTSANTYYDVGTETTTCP